MKNKLSFLGQLHNVDCVQIDHHDRIVLPVDKFVYCYGLESDLESVAAHALQLHDVNAPERNLDDAKAEIRLKLGLREPKDLVVNTAAKQAKKAVKSKTKKQAR